MSDLYAVILSGGAGTRLWPRSRRERPKQFLDLAGERTLFAETVRRVEPLVPRARIFVVAPPAHAALIHGELPDLGEANLVLEPYPRGNAAAIALVVAAIAGRDPAALVAVLPSDHVIVDPEGFRRCLGLARDAAMDGSLLTLGIQPTGPDTGFGYIERTEERLGEGAFRVRRFVEKPKREVAEEMLRTGRYLWNAGMFIFAAEAVRAEYGRQLPRTAAALEALARAAGTSRWTAVLADVWEETEKTTFDYGILEHAASVAVVPADIGFHDVGNWARLASIVTKTDNFAVGSLLAEGSQGLYVYSPGKVVAAIGVEGLVIVETEDALLVCRKDRAEEVKAIVERLGREGRTELL